MGQVRRERKLKLRDTLAALHALLRIQAHRRDLRIVLEDDDQVLGTAGSRASAREHEAKD